MSLIPIPENLRYLIEKRLRELDRRNDHRRSASDRRTADLGPIGAIESLESIESIDDLLLDDRRTSDKRRTKNPRRIRTRRQDDQ
jgi:hypothetical protein